MDIQLVKSEITALHTWSADHGHNYSSINTVPEGRWVTWLRSRSPLFGVAWRQLFRISPVDFRPAFGPRVLRRDPKATILFALAYLELVDGGEQAYLGHCKQLLGRVLEMRSPKARYFGVRQNNTLCLKVYSASNDDVSPLLTAWAGRMFLRASRYTRDPVFLKYASAVASYFLEEHPRKEEPEGTYFYYDPSIPDVIINASGEISSYLVEFGMVSGDQRASDVGRDGLRYLIAHQNDDGSWFYGAGPQFQYIDNFHTAFVLQAIASAIEYMDWPALDECLRRGTHYFTSTLFRDSPAGLRPIHLDRRFLPLNSNLFQRVDLRDVTVSVVLFLELAKRDRRYWDSARRLLQWAFCHMRSAQGTYYPEVTMLWKNGIPYIEFQAWMLYCLARYWNVAGRMN